MDTLYTLCRCVDRQFPLPLTSEDVSAVAERKKALFAAEAKENPLVREILQGGVIKCRLFKNRGEGDFTVGAATFFRTHEILRHTRSANFPIILGDCEYDHNEVATLFARCVPNVKLHHIPWFSPGRYSMSVGLAWGSTLLTSHVVARGAVNDGVLDHSVLFHVGVYSTVGAVVYTTLRQNRDIRRSAPWNSALYLDLNTDFIRRDLPAVALARKEVIPRQRPFKTHAFYYALARKIEAHGFDEELRRGLPSGSTASASR